MLSVRSFIVVSLVLGLSACSSGGGDDSSNSAFLRVLHDSPDAPNVDVLIDGHTVLSDVPYGDSSGYLSLESGERRIQVNAAGSNTTVIDATADLAQDSYSTVIAANLVADIEPLVLQDDRTEPQHGNARIRVVHGAPSAPDVDVYATAPGADLESAEPVLAGVPFKTASAYLEVPAGTYEFRVTIAGTKTVAIDSGAVNLEDGSLSTAVAADARGGGAPFSIILLSDN